VIGAIALSLTRHHNWPKKLEQKIYILIYCFLSTTVALGLLFLGYDKTSALTASILNSIYPVLVALVGMFILHERITRRENMGMGLALLGTAIVTAEPFINGTVTSSTTLLGNLLVIASLLVGVLVAVLTKILLRHPTNPLSLTHLSFIIGFFTLAPIVLMQTPIAEIFRQIISAPWQAHLGVVYMAILSGTIAYTLWNVGQKTIEIGESSLFTYIYPVITLPLSVFWLKEPISVYLIVGAIVITIGVIIAEKKVKKTNRRRLA
jgi:drug/metabolite transporter (DMT)-like permease